MATREKPAADERIGWIEAALTRVQTAARGGSPASVLHEASQVIEAAADAGRRDLEGRARAALAYICCELGDIEQAFEHSERALELARSTNDTMTYVDAGNALGLAYAASGQHERARRVHLDAAHQAERGSDPAGLARSIGNVSLAELMMIELAEAEGVTGDDLVPLAMAALAHAHDALALFAQTDQPGGALVVRSVAAQARAHLGELQAAEGELLSLGVDALAQGNLVGQADAAEGLGFVYRRQHRFDNAAASYRQAIDIATAAGARDLVATAHLRLSELYEQTGHMGCALRHYKHHHELRLAILTERAAVRGQVLAAQAEAQRATADADSQRRRAAALSRRNRRLDQMAKTDPLTGLANRRPLQAALSEVMEQESVASVAVFDVDNFKTVNDAIGHIAGDRVLAQIAQLLAANCRDTDLPARMGGEEFVVVFRDVDIKTATALCERMRDAIESFPWTTHGLEQCVTVSVGIATTREVASDDELLDLADRRLFLAKAAGRNRVAAI